LSHLLTILASRKRLIGGATLAGGVLAAAVAFLLPNTYTASAVIMSPQKEQSMMSMLAGQLGPLAAVAGADLALKNPADLYVGLLGSRTIADDLIGQFGLQVLYRAKSNVEARDELKSHSRFNTGRDSLIRIEVDDRDPRRAAAIANAFVSELAAQNKRLALTESGQRRAFLEKQLTDEKANLATAEDAMKGTQQRTGVIDVGGQAGLAIASLAQIRAEITAHEVALERLKMSATPQNPDVLATEAELDALRAQFRNLDKISGGPLISASAVPAAGLTYVRSLRELKYHEFLYEMLAKQYEAARLDENKSAPALQIVDIAIPPDRKSGPHRSLITILGCFGGAAMAMIAAYVQWQRR
jgi:uncharacterized protein involved in exopolysaccharide biosynthesis